MIARAFGWLHSPLVLRVVRGSSGVAAALGLDAWSGAPGGRRGRRLIGGIALLSCVSALLISGAPAQAVASCPAGYPSTPSTFGYTGSEQCFVVPANVTSARIAAVGGSSQYFSATSHGAKVAATVAVTPGSTLYVEVGGAPSVNSVSNASGLAGGFNGGASGGSGSGETAAYDGGAGGGGASDVSTCSMTDPSCMLTAAPGDPRLVVAGGAGGTGSSTNGGNAGATNSGAGQGGDNSPSAGGTGGTGSGGGSGGGSGVIAGANGTSGQGGTGGSGAGLFHYAGGGGGGGGYVGGGGGSAGGNSAGGGGGSSYGPPGATISTDAIDQPSVTITPGSATVLSSSRSPSTGGQVTFTATVAGASPTGSVTFSDGSMVVCFAQALSGGVATCTTSDLSVGGHSITAAYSGDTNNSQSTSPVFTQTVLGQTVMASTTTAVSSSRNPSSAGQPVTFSASVAGLSPTGSVTFSDGSMVVCFAQALSGGVATCTTSDLSVGGHSITAVYSGDTNNSQSTSPVIMQTVLGQTVMASTATAVSSSRSPSAAGQPVTFTAAVAGASPSGSVRFMDGGSTLTSCGTQPLTGTTATCITSSLGVGTHAITAAYSGSADTASSTSNALQQSIVAPVPTNHFRLSAVMAHAVGSVRLSLALPGAGAIDVLETASISRAARIDLPQPPRGSFAFGRTHTAATARGRRAIAQSRRAHRPLFINLSVRYIPRGGTARTQTKRHMRIKQ
jgi:hypothetical protein